MRNLFAILILLSAVTASAGRLPIVDGTFNPGTGVEGGLAESVVPIPNGQMYLSGNFTKFNGQDYSYIVRLNENGSLDTSFKAGPGYWVRHMAVQNDGKVVIVGYFTTVSGISRNLIARLNQDGSLDTSFNPGTGAEVLLGGGIDGNNTPFIFQVAIQPDGKIVIVGNFLKYNGVGRSGIARLNPDGSLDTTFNPGSGFNSWGRSVQILPDGKILVTGWFESYNGRPANRMVVILPNGDKDESFNSNFGDKTAIYSAAKVADNKIIAVGHSLNEQGLFNKQMERLNSNGTVDSSFPAKTNEKTEDVVIQPDGKIIVAGYFTKANDQPREKIARFLSDGSLDPDFRASFDNFIWTVALDRNGKLLAAGAFNTVEGEPRRGIVRLNTGAIATPGNAAPVVNITAPPAGATFTPGANIPVTATASDSDGSIARVQLFANGNLLGDKTSAPYTFTLSAAPAGTYALQAKATDDKGLTSSSTIVNITVRAQENIPPTITLSSPAQNQQFTAPASIQLAVNTSDSDGQVARVRFFSGATLIGTTETQPYSFTWSNVPTGEYQLKAEAEDNQGARSSTGNVSIRVTQSVPVNAPPVVNITAPTAGATFTPGANVSVTATATDSDGSIARAQLFANGNLAGEKTSPPYTFNLSSTPAGTYALQVKATDDKGLTGSSPVVTITVRAQENSPPTITLATPSQNQEFAAPAAIQLTVNTTDTDGQVARVRYFSGAALIGTAEAQPFSFAWNNVPAGEYQLKAEAEDNLGARSSSANVTVRVVQSTTPVPRIKNITVKDGQILITAFGPSGGNYRVQASSSLQNPQWEIVWTIRGSTMDTLIPLPLTGSSRFFRMIRF